MSGGIVARLSIAPVKGLGLVHPRRVTLTRAGAAGDRRFHLSDEDGHVVNGKRAGTLVQIRPDYDAERETLHLRFPDGTWVTGPVIPGKATTTSFWGRPVPGRLVEGPWAEALSSFAGMPLRLVRSDEPGAGGDRGATVTLASTASFSRVAEAGGRTVPVDGRRFRMLFDVDGIDAHAEDAWVGRYVRVGGATIVVRGHVGRCVVTTRDPDAGVRDFDTLRALAVYRRGLETTERLSLGVWGDVVDPGTVFVGAAVRAHRIERQAAASVAWCA